MNDYDNCVALSGIRSTAPTLHVGNYFGALKKFVALQGLVPNQGFFFIADGHSIGDVTSGQALRYNSLSVAIEFLASGLNPEQATIYIQSQVPELFHLTWLLTALCKDTDVMNLPHYREKRDKFAAGQSSEGAPFTYLAYPVLQAADILFPAMAEQKILVPVGEDQRPHVEFTRDLAKAFNRRYGQIFGQPIMPEDLGLYPGADDPEQEGPVRIKGLDGKEKMGKSEGNAVYLEDSPEQIRKLIKPAVTDPQKQRLGDPGNPKDCRGVFPLHLYVTDKVARDQTVRPGCLSGALSCTDCKKILADNLVEMFAAFRERKAELQNDPNYVLDVLSAGATRARQLVKTKVAEMSDLMGLYLPKEH